MADFYFYNDGTGDTDWNNPNNWWLDSGYTSTVGAVPTPLPGQLVEIDTQLDANIPNWTFGVVIGNTTVTLTVDNVCSGSITVFFPGVLNIQGSTLTLYGSLSNEGTINLIGGAFDLQGGNISNTYSINISNGTTLLNNGGILDNSGGYLTNYGTINNSGIFAQGNFFNYGIYINNYYFYNNGAGDTNWNGVANWFYDSAHIFAVGDVPTIIIGQDIINIHSPVDTNIPSVINFPINIYDFSILTINNYVINTNSIILYNHSELITVLGSLLENKNIISIHDYGVFQNNGSISNTGTLRLSEYGTLNSTGYMDNRGTCYTSLYDTSVMSIDQTKYSGNYYLRYYYSINEVYYDVTLQQHVSSLDNIQTTDTIYITDTIEYNVFAYIGCSIVNNATLTLPGNNTQHYPFINSGTLIINGELFSAASITNNGNITNNGGLYITDMLVISPTANLNNNGTFSYGNNYSTKFKGPIYPQVPSSASWGNIFI